MQLQPFTTQSHLALGEKRPFRRHRVYWRRSWTARWQPADYVTCDSYTRGVMPGGSSATLIYQAGRIKREDASAFAESTARLRVGTFVLINVLPSADDLEAFAANEAGNQDLPKIIDQWVGVVVHEQLAVGHGSAGIAPQDQVLTCQGLEHLMATAMINGSYSIDANGDILPRFDTVIPFNDRIRWGQPLIGNRSQSTAEIAEGVSCYVFDGDADTATTWTVHNAVDYLLKLLSPALPGSIGPLRFALTGQAAELNNIILPRTDVEGMSILAALNALIDIRRGFGWCIRVPLIELDEEGADQAEVTPEIHVFSVADAPVTLSDVTLPANSDASDLDLTGRIDVVDCRFTIDDRAYYGRINVMGERLLVCAPFSVYNGTLVKGWTDTEQTKYVNATGATSAADKDNQRRLDGFRHVFSLLRVPETWDFRAGNYFLNAKHNANPLITDDGYLDVTQTAPIRGVWGLTFERYIPFFKAPLHSVDARADVREPAVFLADPNYDGVWITSDSVPVEVRVADHELAVQLVAHPNHLLAKDVVTSITSAATPAYDYRLAQIVVAFRTDQRLRVRGDVPIVALPGETEDEYNDRVQVLRERELRIEVPGAEMVYVVPDTPLEISGALDGLTFGELVLHEGGTIRNDVNVLRRVYTAARAWFGRPRASVAITLRNVEPEPKVGGLIKFVKQTWGSVEVRSVVTMQTVNLTQQTTTIQTNYLELDFARRNGR